MAFFVPLLATAFTGTYVVAYENGLPSLAAEFEGVVPDGFCVQSNFKAVNHVVLSVPCTVTLEVVDGRADTNVFNSADNTFTTVKLETARISDHFTAASVLFPDDWNCYNDKQSVEVRFLQYKVEVSNKTFLKGQNKIRFTGTSVFMIGSAYLELANVTANLSVASGLYLTPTADVIACASCQQQFVFSGKRVDFASIHTENIEIQRLSGQIWERVTSATVLSLSPQPDKLAIQVKTDIPGDSAQYLRLSIVYKDICGNTSYFYGGFTHIYIQQYGIKYEADKYYTDCSAVRNAVSALPCTCVLQLATTDPAFGFSQTLVGERIQFGFTANQKMKALPFSTTDYLYYCQGTPGAKFALKIDNYAGKFEKDGYTKVCVDKEFYTFADVPSDCQHVVRAVNGNALTATYYSCLDFIEVLTVPYSGFKVYYSVSLSQNSTNNAIFNVTVTTTGSSVSGVYGTLGEETTQCAAGAGAQVYSCSFYQFGTYKVYAQLDTECYYKEPYFLFDHTVLADAYLLLTNNPTWRAQDFATLQSLRRNFIYYYQFSNPTMAFQNSTCEVEYNDYQLIFTKAGPCELRISYAANYITYLISVTAGPAIYGIPQCVYATNEYDAHRADLKLYENAHYSVVCTVTIRAENGSESSLSVPQNNMTVNSQPAQYFKAAALLQMKYHAGLQILYFNITAVVEKLSISTVYQYDALTVNEKLAFVEGFTPAQTNALSQFISRYFNNCTSNCVSNAYYQPLSKAMVRLAQLDRQQPDAVQNEIALQFVQNRLAFYRLFAPVLKEFADLAQNSVFGVEFTYSLFNTVPVLPLQEESQVSLHLTDGYQFHLFVVPSTSPRRLFQTQSTYVEATYLNLPLGYQGTGCKIGIFEVSRNQSVYIACTGNVTVRFTATKGACQVHQFGESELAYFRSVYARTEMQNCSTSKSAGEITCQCSIGQYGGRIILVVPEAKFTGWEIFGIVVGVVAGLALLVGAGFLLYWLLGKSHGLARGVRSIRQIR